MQVYHTPELLPHPSVVTFGNFDGVHLGHLALLSALSGVSKLADLHRVVITFDPHPFCFLKRKKDFLITDQYTKTVLLSPYADSLYFIKFDDELRSLSPEDFLKFLSSFLNLKYLINAENCRFGKFSSGGIAEIEKYQELLSYKAVVIKPELNDSGSRYSSTLVRTSIKDGDMLSARQLLGRYHSIRGIIRRDRGLASTIGFPTINIAIPEEIIKPRLGVYVVDVSIEGTIHRGIANIGKRPTTSGSGEVILEVHIFNFSDNVYGKDATVYLKAFLREEKLFPSVERLREQILADIRAVLSMNF
ncbi:riboflavin biosynthesis protein RibF [Neorickettsia sennetsu]|uniref:Riboflavin biosynthesis protein n=1 Tax=Ehrlichia sennetsu (strain ATCC VR-367 / Miyayama) TaxID=222891 RepID=Q2GF14_EHRS3|nr:riboflavin biosynthesis protein RibF [Neorickettsia sennetsu]ABD46376.1 riboflavin biosynthesis protein RibF [Neorickettsia sennetsu str. Miyayama]